MAQIRGSLRSRIDELVVEIASVENQVENLEEQVRLLEGEGETLRRDLEVAEQESEEGHQAVEWQKQIAPELIELDKALKDLKDQLWMTHMNKSMPADMRNMARSFHDKMERPCEEIIAIVRGLE